MQPYQQASEEHNRQALRPVEAAASVAGIGLKGAIGGRVMSMLNKYVPSSLMAKGLNKIDPRLGKLMYLGQESGHSTEDIAQFITGKMRTFEPKEVPKQEKNIIEQESPELHSFLDQEIRGGRKPIEAAALAQNDKRFSDVVKKLMQKHKTPWSKIIESIYGIGDTALPSGQQAQPQQPQQGAQPGPGSQKLMDIMTQINQKLGP